METRRRDGLLWLLGGIAAAVCAVFVLAAAVGFAVTVIPLLIVSIVFAVLIDMLHPN